MFQTRSFGMKVGAKNEDFYLNNATNSESNEGEPSNLQRPWAGPATRALGEEKWETDYTLESIWEHINQRFLQVITRVKP